MTAETIKLLVRHGLTALGPFLLMLDIPVGDEYGQMVNTVADAAGAVSIAVGLVWSFIRKLSAKKEKENAQTP